MAILNSKGWVWWVERGKLAIGTSSDHGSTVSPPSEASKVVRIYGKEVAPVDNGSGTDIAEFTTGASIDTAQFSKLPEQYHEALIAKVMEKLYRKNVEGIQISQYWRSVYQDLLISAKKYSNSRRLDTGFNVIQHDM